MRLLPAGRVAAELLSGPLSTRGHSAPNVETTDHPVTSLSTIPWARLVERGCKRFWGFAAGRYAASKSTQKGEIVQVDGTRFVAFVESPLLVERDTLHAPPSDHALGEAIRRVVKMTTPKVGLSSVSVGSEHDRVKVHPSAAGSN